MDAEASHVEGPEPMIDKKPVKARYEEQGISKLEILEVVESHNKAHPILKDELEKRRSVAKVTPGTCNASTMVTYDEYKKLRRRADGTHNTRWYVRRDPIYSRRKKAKVTKRSKRLHKRRYKYGRQKSSIGICSRCRHTTATNKRIGTDESHDITCLNLERSNNNDNPKTNRTQLKVGSQTKLKKNDPTEDNDDVFSTGYPNTSRHSYGSYHSFASMDDEPTDT